MADEKMEFDVVIVGAGPAGLSAAIRLKQINPNCNVCILEKGASVGAHILSGAVLEPTALNELIPNWQQLNPPEFIPVTEDRFILLTKKRAWRLPTPAPMKNHGNYIISLGLFCQWLANHAESLGVQIFPGFAASELIEENSQICGVITGAMGLDSNGKPTERYQPGVKLLAKLTLLAEGCRGSLTKKIIQKFNLQKNCQEENILLLR